MYFKRLLALPFLWVIAFVTGMVLLFDSVYFSAFLRTEIGIVKLLAFLGAFGAAMSFERGAYLRRAWLLIGACMLFLLLRDALVALEIPGITIISAVLVTAGNLVQVIGTWLLARSWSVAELALPGTRGKQWMVLAAAIVFALIVAGPPLAENAKALFSGDLSQMTSLASGAGDIISLCLIAPLLLTALALRGGMLAWPWSLITISYVSWLFYDASSFYAPMLHLQSQQVRALSEVFRTFGCLFQFSAGMSQRHVTRLLRS